MEQWKEIDGTGGRLLISDHGRVKSLLRDGRILKTATDKKGYVRLRVTLDRKKYAYKVHRLVAKAFIENPEGKPQVNHINGNKTDNRAINLEWVSNAENAHHAIQSGLWKNVFEMSRRENKRREKRVIGIAPDGKHMLFKSVSEAERIVGSRHIAAVLTGKRCHAKGWSFVYAEGGDADAHD